MSNIVDLNSYRKQKFFNQIEEIRKQNYNIIRMFPRLNSEAILSNLYKLEQSNQFLFDPDYQENVSPCFSSFSCEGFYAVGEEHLHSLYLKSTLSLYELSKTSSTSYIEKDDGTVSSNLPTIAMFSYSKIKSTLPTKDVDLLELDRILNATPGVTFFSSVVCVLLEPYIIENEDLDLFEIGSLSVHKTPETSDLLEIILQDRQHELKVYLNLEVCESEFNKFIEKNKV